MGDAGSLTVDGAETGRPVETMRSERFLVAVCMTGFSLVGLLSALIGPSLLIFSESIGRPVGDLAVVVSLDAFGSVCGSLLAGVYARFGSVRSQGFLGCLGIVAAVLVVPRMNGFETLSVAAFGLGLSKTFLIVTVNTLLIKGRGRSAGKLISSADITLGAGSLLMPIIIARVLTVGLGLHVSYLVPCFIAAALGLAFILFFPSARLDDWNNDVEDKPSTPVSGNGTDRHGSVAITGAVAATLFFYVGLEASLSAFLPSFVATRDLVSSAATAGMFTSLFWASITLGRLLWIPAFSRLSPTTILKWAACVAATGFVIGATGRSSTELTGLAVVLIGLASAPVFPTMFMILNARTSMDGWVSGTALSAASIGAMFFPYLTGSFLL